MQHVSVILLQLQTLRLQNSTLEKLLKKNLADSTFEKNSEIASD